MTHEMHWCARLDCNLFRLALNSGVQEFLVRSMQVCMYGCHLGFRERQVFRGSVSLNMALGLFTLIC